MKVRGTKQLSSNTCFGATRSPIAKGGYDKASLAAALATGNDMKTPTRHQNYICSHMAE